MEKVAGIKKYEVNEKLTLPDFYKLLINVTDGNDFTMDDVVHVLESSVKEGIFFKEKDPYSNPLMKRMHDKMKELQVNKVPVGKK